MQQPCHMHDEQRMVEGLTPGMTMPAAEVMHILAWISSACWNLQ